MNFPTPSVTTTLADIGSWAVPIFTDFFPFGKIAIGVIVGFGIVAFLIKQFSHTLHKHT